MTYQLDKTFEKINFSEITFENGEYENCHFIQCDFSNVQLNGSKFIDCDFKDSNLSLARVKNTGFQQVQFEQCKMLGILFEGCNPFGLQFINIVIK